MIFLQKTLKHINLILFLSFISVFLMISTNLSAKNQYYNIDYDSLIDNDNGFVEKFKDWSIYNYEKNNERYCFALSRPIATKSNILSRAKPYFIVNDLIYDSDEILTVSGFKYKNNSDIEVSFGVKKFYLMNYEFNGWAYNKNDDLDIIKSMQENAEFSVTSYSEDNHYAIDRYSLIGFKQAYFKLKEICRQK